MAWPEWTIVVPVRLGPHAKRRLAAPQRLAAAIVADCLAAVDATASVRRLVVVCAAGPVPTLPTRADVVHQPSDTPGLTAAIALGLEHAEGPTAVLLADLPALRPASLTAALAAGARRQLADPARPGWYVPDADDVGTVLLGGPTARLPIRFGPHSAQAHHDAGSRPLPCHDLRLRRDVDTPADLIEAWRLGVGAHTATTIIDVQVTVLEYSVETGRGHVVTDDGLRLELPSAALQGSGLRHLRSGQRLTCLISEGVVVAVRILGVGDPLPDH